jgi:hypothetical protein
MLKKQTSNGFVNVTAPHAANAPVAKDVNENVDI